MTVLENPRVAPILASVGMFGSFDYLFLIWIDLFDHDFHRILDLTHIFIGFWSFFPSVS